MSDDCGIGKNGCYALQEVQKNMIAYKTNNEAIKEDVSENKDAIKNINGILLKHASIIGSVTIIIQILFKFWK